MLLRGFIRLPAFFFVTRSDGNPAIDEEKWTVDPDSGRAFDRVVPRRATLRYGYKASAPGQISLSEGAVVDVIEGDAAADFWSVRCLLDGREGLCQRDYLEEMGKETLESDIILEQDGGASVILLRPKARVAAQKWVTQHFPQSNGAARVRVPGSQVFAPGRQLSDNDGLEETTKGVQVGLCALGGKYSSIKQHMDVAKPREDGSHVWDDVEDEAKGAYEAAAVAQKDNLDAILQHVRQEILKMAAEDQGMLAEAPNPNIRLIQMDYGSNDAVRAVKAVVRTDMTLIQTMQWVDRHEAYFALGGTGSSRGIKVFADKDDAQNGGKHGRPKLHTNATLKVTFKMPMLKAGIVLDMGTDKNTGAERPDITLEGNNIMVTSIAAEDEDTFDQVFSLNWLVANLYDTNTSFGIAQAGDMPNDAEMHAWTMAIFCDELKNSNADENVQIKDLVAVCGEPSEQRVAARSPARCNA